jgi:protein-S-isoprenylcysteine O-methyltransferase Ste14
MEVMVGIMDKRKENIVMNEAPAYGLWPLVIINAAVFIIFAFSFTKPKTTRDWRSFGMFSAFIIALMTEMYGFPLTIYLLSGWLTSKFPGMNLYSHDMGHLFNAFMGWQGDPHFSPLHILSYVFIGGGFIMLSSAWEKLYKAQKQHKLATTGLYAHIRHPQYVAFIAIMFGFLLQWPTLVTIGMFPILLVMYARLAVSEEKNMEKEFGEQYVDYKKDTPAFIPKLKV